MKDLKPFASIEQQVEILRGRGLELPDEGAVKNVLTRNSYYRLSGYMRYFQVAPSAGNENFHAGTRWEDILEIYDLDLRLRAFLLEGLQLAEIALRTAFANSEATAHSPYKNYLCSDSYKSPPNPRITPTDEIIESELRRSKELFMQKFRSKASTSDDWLSYVPVWGAVEVLSFGTLAKAISYRKDENCVYSMVCESLGAGKGQLAPQLRSFVFLRNKSAHFSRIWNLFVQDPPAVANKAKQQAKKKIGQYDGNSVLAVIVALDDFLKKARIVDDFLSRYSNQFSDVQEFHQGIAHPRNA